MKRKNTLIPAYILMFFVIFILPFFSVEGYSIIKNTTSQLGAQQTPNAFVMNFVFFSLGITALIEGLRRLRKFYFHKILITIFSVSLIFTAFYQHAPILQNIAYNVKEDQAHSVFATITGFSFTFFAIASSFIIESNKNRVIAVSVGIFAMLLSILMFTCSEYMGMIQRLMFIVSFAWLIYFYEGLNETTNRCGNK